MKPATMKLYVWYPDSLTDHTGGMVCVIAESVRAARELAVLERYPCHQSASDEKLRVAFRAELRTESPIVIKRGAVHIFGGG